MTPPPKVELVWDGKYDASGRKRTVDAKVLCQPIRTLERYGAADSVPNRLIQGDNKAVMASLLPELRGAIDLIVMDPPFDAGTTFPMRLAVGEGDTLQEIEIPAYRDIWGTGTDSFLHMMYERLTLAYDLLAPTGSFYLHCDERVSHHLRGILDEIFGPERFQREIVWRIGWISGFKARAKNWIRNHDTILFYTKSGNFTFNKIHIPYPPDYLRRDGRKPTGPGYPIEDTWNCSEIDRLDSIQIMSFTREKSGYATQKNENLLERMIACSSNEGDLVADFFCGSGTAGVVSQRLRRRWLLADESLLAIQTTKKRLWETDAGVSFECQSLDSGQPATSPSPMVKAQARKKNGYWRVSVDDFAPDWDALPAQWREKLKDLPGSAMLDSWLVGSTGEPFTPLWRDYRTRKKRTLALESEPLEKAPPYVLLATDVFGYAVKLEVDEKP